MAEKHHHLSHHKKGEDHGPVDYRKEEKHHKHLEHLGKAGAAAAGACNVPALSPFGHFVLTSHEKHRAKKDPEHAHSHKVKEEIAATITVAAGGFALHEKHERKAAKKEDKKLHGKHHQYHLF
ncbi:Abscisic stress-ripening protein 2 [Morella rubra]|uniref:Abscisic stress-ripening protein 2 n=1 Tax=Morella rubra TaxID=262757 RepID=A0A6A1VJY9_9ROSI|nr:Abscisic stress-ripening protein 2 [Morella rubra]KAB1218886.1 Abscisic stress-ripening protein 2 [Morella rubra]